MPEGDWLVATGMTVRFGGRVAVDHVDLRVGARELVGLIGTNGAGKSTLMNAIGGFVPAEGHVEVLGRDVTGLPAYRRHRLGLGRTFQAARLYDDLTVRETVMVALEARERSRVVPSMLHVPPSPRAERRKRAEADDILAALGLGDAADQPAAALSTGHATTGRARRSARARRARRAARRADRRSVAARDRGVRPAPARDPARPRRRGAAHRARHAAGDVGERPRVLPRGRSRHRRGQSRARCAPTRS